MKKIFFNILLVFLITFFSGSVASASEVVVTVQHVTGVSGETVTVLIRAENASMVAGGQFDLFYDPSKVEVKSINRGDLISGLFMGNEQYRQDSLRVVWAGLEGPGKEEGTFCEVVFSLKTPGESVLKLSNVSLKDSSAENVPYRTTNGSITATGSSRQEHGQVIEGDEPGSVENGRITGESDKDETEDNNQVDSDDISGTPDDPSGSLSEDRLNNDDNNAEGEFSGEDTPEGAAAENDNLRGSFNLSESRWLLVPSFLAVVILGIYWYKKRNIS